MTVASVPMRILLTNDDGIDAPGLAVLQHVAADLGGELWVVAPERDQSGTSHSITLHSPIRASKKGDRRFSVSGTPGDCVVMAVKHLMPGVPALVLSGVNRGANVGMATVFSGTVGAAMTAVLLGIPSIALSQAYTDVASVPWETSRSLGGGVLRALLEANLGAPTCFNVNFPAVPANTAGAARVTRQGAGIYESIDVIPRTDPRGENYFWLQFKRGFRANAQDTETAAIAAGHIAVTPLQFERTDEAARTNLLEALNLP